MTVATSKAVVKNSDMDESMLNTAVRLAACAMEKHTEDKDIASYIKREFNTNYGRTWHCIVGKQYGSDVSHEENCFIYFFIGDRAIQLFKSG